MQRGQQHTHSVGGDLRDPETGGAQSSTEQRLRHELDHEERHLSRVLDPSGQLYHHWSLIVSLAFLYNFWALSYRFAFQEINQATLALWFTLDYTADLVYLADILINCRTGYLEDGVLIRNRNKTRHHYQECTRFYLDCLCLLPLDILYLTLGFNSIVRCLRLVKIYKFWSFLDRTERHTNYPNVFRTCTLVHYILVIFHWNACLFHMISKKNILDIQNLYNISSFACNGTLCQYLHAFYWSTLALTMVGDLPRPRTKAEYVYVIVELFFGLFLVATVLGHVSNIVTNVSAARKEFQARLDAVKTFMRMRRVSDKLQDKVIRWFDYLWITQKSSDEERSVACLPDRLKAEIAIHVHLDTLRRVDIFQNTEAGFLCELVLRLKLVLFSPGDYVCRKNEVGHEMYIVSRGHLEVLKESESRVVATLRAGSYFGEISVLNVGLAGNKRTASVRSVGYSDLFCLNKQDLWDVLKNYPNAEVRIRARAEERLNKLDIGAHQQPQQLLQQQQQPQQVKSTHRCAAGGAGARPSASHHKGSFCGHLHAGTGHHRRHHRHRHHHHHHNHHHHCQVPQEPRAQPHRQAVKLSRSLTDTDAALPEPEARGWPASASVASSPDSLSSDGVSLLSEPPEGSPGVGPARVAANSGRPWCHDDAAGWGPRRQLEEPSSGSASGAPSGGGGAHRRHWQTGRQAAATRKRGPLVRGGGGGASCQHQSRHLCTGCAEDPCGPDSDVTAWCWHTHPSRGPAAPVAPALGPHCGPADLCCWLAAAAAAASQQPPAPEEAAAAAATPLLQVPLVALVAGQQLGPPSPACSQAASFRSQRTPARPAAARLSSAASLDTAAAPLQPALGPQPEPGTP